MLQVPASYEMQFMNAFVRNAPLGAGQFRALETELPQARFGRIARLSGDCFLLPTQASHDARLFAHAHALSIATRYGFLDSLSRAKELASLYRNDGAVNHFVPHHTIGFNHTLPRELVPAGYYYGEFLPAFRRALIPHLNKELERLTNNEHTATAALESGLRLYHLQRLAEAQLVSSTIAQAFLIAAERDAQDQFNQVADHPLVKIVSESAVPRPARTFAKRAWQLGLPTLLINLFLGIPYLSGIAGTGLVLGLAVGITHMISAAFRSPLDFVMDKERIAPELRFALKEAMSRACRLSELFGDVGPTYGRIAVANAEQEIFALPSPTPSALTKNTTLSLAKRREVQT